MQVEDATASEQRRLEQEKKQTIESLQAKHKLEMDRLTDDIERKHKESLNEIKETLSGRHEQVENIAIIERDDLAILRPIQQYFSHIRMMGE